MSSVPGLALASTANPSLALLGDALAMLPWNRTASPWEQRQRAVPPAGRRHLALRSGRRTQAPAGASTSSSHRPATGKSVLANTINIGLCLSSAVLGTQRRQAAADRQGRYRHSRPKASFGSSRRRSVRSGEHEAIFISLQFAPGYEFNIFDLQVGCEYPLPLEKAFLQNFLALATLPPDQTHALRGHGAADLAGHRRGLPALHRDRWRLQALSAPASSRRSIAAIARHRDQAARRRRPTGATSSTRSATSASIGWPSARSATPCRSLRT